MAGVTKKTGTVVAAPSGDTLLKGLKHIAVQLENGQTVKLSAAQELHIPDGPVGIIQEAQKASARYAFWAYQEEVQLGRVRAAERKLEFIEGGYDQPIRNQLHELTPSGITETAVKAAKDTHDKVRAARMVLDRARKDYGKLRVMRKALDHRCFALDRLVARMAEVQKG